MEENYVRNTVQNLDRRRYFLAGGKGLARFGVIKVVRWTNTVPNAADSGDDDHFGVTGD